jgi:hypothetical protein
MINEVKMPTINIPKDVYDEIVKYLETHEKELRRRHIKAISHLIEELWNHYKETKNIMLEPLKHFNVYEDHVTIWDEEIKQLVDVYNRNGKLVCTWCESETCRHIDFAYEIKEVQQAVKEGKVRRKPIFE